MEKGATVTAVDKEASSSKAHHHLSGDLLDQDYVENWWVRLLA
jgi:hypothetical protein